MCWIRINLTTNFGTPCAMFFRLFHSSLTVFKRTPKQARRLSDKICRGRQKMRQTEKCMSAQNSSSSPTITMIKKKLKF